jgi:hypothetical protein
MKSKVAAAVAVAFAASCLSGCVSVFEGTSQDISVVTNPLGAHCAFKRDDGKDMGSIESTPAKLTVRKSKYDLTITCKKEGYQDAAYLNHSGVSAAIAANVAVDILLTAGISSIVDSANGADNKYDSVVNITMTPLTTTAAAAAAPVPATITGAATAPKLIPVADVTPAETKPGGNAPCTHDQQVQARIAKTNGYTSGPKCD